MDFSKNVIKNPNQAKSKEESKVKPMNRIPMGAGKRVGGSMDRASNPLMV